MKTLRTSLIVLAAVAGAHAASLDASFGEIQKAAWAGDIPTLTKLSQALGGRASDGTPGSAYVAAYADYRLATVGMGDLPHNKKLVDAALDRARSHLESIESTASPYQADALAMLSTVYGITISLHPVSGMTLGAKSGAAIEHAEKLAPGNPRVLLFKGLDKLYTPPLFGGNRDEALAAFGDVVSHLPKSDFTPVNWGLDDAYIWRGVAYAQAGQTDEARASYNAALQVAPGNGWAKHLIATLTQH